MTAGFSDEVTFEQKPETKGAESHTLKKKKGKKEFEEKVENSCLGKLNGKWTK